MEEERCPLWNLLFSCLVILMTIFNAMFGFLSLLCMCISTIDFWFVIIMMLTYDYMYVCVYIYIYVGMYVCIYIIMGFPSGSAVKNLPPVQQMLV